MIERIYCILLMLLGVFSFSFATGALSSIIQNMDSKAAQLEARINTLNEIKDEYGVGNELYKKLTRTIRYDHKLKSKDKSEFLAELPHKLKVELIVLINKKMYETIGFFEKKDQSFLGWIATILKTSNFEMNEYIYKEEEECHEIYFILKGQIGYVLPRFGNISFKTFEQGAHFGHLELGGLKRLFDESDRSKLTQHLKNPANRPARKFTTMAMEHTELLSLHVSDLVVMRAEFQNIFEELFNNYKEILRGELNQKMEIIRQKELQNAKQNNSGALASQLAYKVLGDLQNKILQNAQTKTLDFQGMLGQLQAASRDSAMMRNTLANQLMSKKSIGRDTKPPEPPKLGLFAALKAARENAKAAATAAQAPLQPDQTGTQSSGLRQFFNPNAIPEAQAPILQKVTLPEDEQINRDHEPDGTGYNYKAPTGMWPTHFHQNLENNHEQYEEIKEEDDNSSLPQRDQENRAIVGGGQLGPTTADMNDVRINQLAQLNTQSRNQESSSGIMGISPLHGQPKKGPAIRHQTIDDNAGDVPADLILTAGKNKSHQPSFRHNTKTQSSPNDRRQTYLEQLVEEEDNEIEMQDTADERKRHIEKMRNALYDDYADEDMQQNYQEVDDDDYRETGDQYPEEGWRQALQQQVELNMQSQQEMRMMLEGFMLLQQTMLKQMSTGKQSDDPQAMLGLNSLQNRSTVKNIKTKRSQKSRRKSRRV